jgi:hypothetical protein
MFKTSMQARMLLTQAKQNATMQQVMRSQILQRPQTRNIAKEYMRMSMLQNQTR